MPAVDRWWEDTSAAPASPAPGPQPPPNPTPPPYNSKLASPTPNPSTPVDPRWDGIAAGLKTELEDLALQWQQMAGFAATINEDALVAMAKAHVVTLKDMGQWIWNNSGWSTTLLANMPWLAFGVDQTTWLRQAGDFQDVIQRYTGSRPDLTGDNAIDPNVPWQQWIWNAMKSGQSVSGFTEALIQDENIRKQYGWIRFGLSFDDFQNRKTDWRQAFGQDLSNEQALLQLEYFHQSAGASRGAQVAPPRGQDPAAAGVSEVTVR